MGLSHGCRIGRRDRQGGREREWRVIAVEADCVGGEDTHQRTQREDGREDERNPAHIEF